MADVEAAVKIFSTSTLQPVLEQLTVRSKAQVVADWTQKQNNWKSKQDFTSKIEKCTDKMALHLKEKGFSYKRMESIFSSCVSHEEFDKHLERAKIRKPWRKILWQHFLGKTTS